MKVTLGLVVLYSRPLPPVGRLMALLELRCCSTLPDVYLSYLSRCVRWKSHLTEAFKRLLGMIVYLCLFMPFIIDFPSITVIKINLCLSLCSLRLLSLLGDCSWCMRVAEIMDSFIYVMNVLCVLCPTWLQPVLIPQVCPSVWAPRSCGCGGQKLCSC